MLCIGCGQCMHRIIALLIKGGNGSGLCQLRQEPSHSPVGGSKLLRQRLLQDGDLPLQSRTLSGGPIATFLEVADLRRQLQTPRTAIHQR
eukprot:gene12696-biopygen9336